jgi:hypothetical protein
MSIYRQCEARHDVPCYSWIGLQEVAGRTLDGAIIGPLMACATHRRWLGVHVMAEWLDPARVRLLTEDEALALRDEQDAEDIIDSDGRLLPRGLR